MSRTSQRATIEDFRDTNDRFLLPVKFQHVIRYRDMYLQQAEVTALRNILGEAAAEAVLRHVPDAIGELKQAAFTNVEADGGEDELAYVTIRLSDPTYSFTLQVGPRTLLIEKRRASLEDTLVTCALISDVLDTLFATQEHSFARIFYIPEKITRVQTTFEYNLTLGNRISNRLQACNNVDVMERILRLGMSPGGRTADAPLGALQGEQTLRADMIYMFNRTLRDELRTIVVDLKAASNNRQRDIDLTLMCGSGYSGVPVRGNQATDLQVPLIEFLRDLCLGRLFEDLFFDASVTAQV